MIVTDVHKDTERLTLALTTTLPVSVERAWALWSDPRQLERWWGPPTWPATFVDHELVPGGRATYYMTGPDGERAGGRWDVVEVDPPRLLVVEDRFVDADGNVVEALPMTLMRLVLDEVDGGTRMTLESQFGSIEAMEQILAMGAAEGMQAAMSQIEAVLAG